MPTLDFIDARSSSADRAAPSDSRPHLDTVQTSPVHPGQAHPSLRPSQAYPGHVPTAPTRSGRAAHASRTEPLMVQLNDSLWRVTRPEGDVLGYVERLQVAEGDRFRAKRFLPRQRRFLIDGEFWAMDDAVACFRAF